MNQKYKVGDYIIALKDRLQFLALIVSTPDEDEYDLELKTDEVGIKWKYEDVDDIDVIKVSDILRHAKSGYDYLYFGSN